MAIGSEEYRRRTVRDYLIPEHPMSDQRLYIERGLVRFRRTRLRSAKT